MSNQQQLPEEVLEKIDELEKLVESELSPDLEKQAEAIAEDMLKTATNKHKYFKRLV